MATLHITVPDEVKTRFEQSFSGQSLDELVTRLMREAVERKPDQETAGNNATIWDFVLNRPYQGMRSKDDIDAQIQEEFVTKAGQNQEVFEALARLIYYFQSIFFESGISILAKLQKENGGSSLFTGVNTAFYLESAIQRFLQVQNTGPVSRNLHQSCLILLDAIVETASSRAYYLREHLVRSRKIL